MTNEVTAQEVKERMVLSLDVGNLESALSLVNLVGDCFGYVKIGSELFAQAGPDSILAMRDLGKKVFLDLKLHDIPNTVERACQVHATRGVSMMTVHASGGEEMLRAARTGLDAGAQSSGEESPILLAVTVLTSLPADPQAFDERLALIKKVGCDLVCSAHEVKQVRDTAHEVRALVPGIRLAGQDKGDQTRVATPFEVIRDGGHWLVLGRAVHGAPDPVAAAAHVANEIASALSQ